MEHYRKELSKIEAERHFIYVRFNARKVFPPIGETFMVQVGTKEFQCVLDNQGRIWANANTLKEFIQFKPQNVFIFTKEIQNKFKIVCARY